MADKVLISGINQPMKMELPNLNVKAIEVIKNSDLYKNAAKEQDKIVNEEKIILGDTVTTNGWDTVSICRVTALNERIKSKKSYPDAIDTSSGTFKLTGEFNPWQVTTGGDGRNIKINIPMKSGMYTGMDFEKGGEKVFDISGVSVDIFVNLDYFPISNSEQLGDGKYEFKVNTDVTSKDDLIASVVSINDPDGKIDTVNLSILQGLYSTWLNIPDNLKLFDTLFAVVLINNMGEESEEYKWLRATAISYAYTDKETEDSSIFGILCMTNDRSKTGLPNQLPAIILENDNNAVFLISRQLFVKYQLLPSLPYIFSESPDAKYTVDGTGLVVSAKDLKLDSVKVGAINYNPVAESFSMSFDESYIQTSAKIHTNISPGIDAYSTITARQTLVIAENDKGEKVMTYKMIGDPVVQNSTDIATWIVVTETILGLIATVVIGVAAVIASKMAALIIGLVVAIVVAAVSAVIHVIIADAIAHGIINATPSVEPMVKVAAGQIQWPFCVSSDFSLKDISYSGAIIFLGKLALEEGCSLVNNRLSYNMKVA